MTAMGGKRTFVAIMFPNHALRSLKRKFRRGKRHHIRIAHSL